MASVVFHAVLCIFVLLIGKSNAAIHLEKISTLYVPFQYDSNNLPLYGMGQGAAEQAAYDPVDKIVYAVGAGKINVVDISNVKSPEILYYKDIGDYDPTDVEFCGSHVFVALDNNINREEGEVHIYKTYDRTNASMQLVLNLRVGALPDMLHPTSDCKTVLVALEGEAYSKENEIVDPEGGVGIIKLFGTDDLAGNYSYKKLNFRKFNDRWSKLEMGGARFIYRENNNTFAQDLEPEYIAYTKDETKAYIGLQENNAIAVVDLAAEDITEILPLGFKRWNTSMLDASDKDGGVNMEGWPIYGMYQPDSIHVIYVNNVEYLVTANEGDSKDYSDYVNGGFNEEARVKDLQLAENSEVLEWAENRNLSDIIAASKLGQLTVTKTNGKMLNSDKYEALYTFGGRSFSIWRTDTMALVYDSGSSIEETHAQLKRELFNSNADSSRNIRESFDTRSDNKGPESESLAIAHLFGKTLIFVGNERPGSISCYSIGSDVTQPTFESIWSGIDSLNGTWGEQYNNRKTSEIDPEDIRFVPASKSPNGKDMLIAAGSVSGTISLFNIEETQKLSEDSPSSAGLLGASVSTIILTVLLQIFRLVQS